MSADGKDLNKNREDGKLEEQIRQQAEDIQVPDSLKPENIEEMLRKTKQKKSFQWKTAYKVMVAAACCVLVIGVAALDLGTSGGDDGKSAKTVASSDKAEENHKIALAKDYDEIFTYIEAQQENTMTGEESIRSLEKVTESSAADSAGPAAGMQAGASADAVTYSDTNIRQAGVEEGDIVKTDGKNLYILNNQKVQIVNIENSDMNEMGTIRVDDNQTILEIYLRDEIMIVVYTRTDYSDGKEGCGGAYQTYTIAETYDVSHAETPKSIGKITQSGYFNTLRVVDEYVYLLSDFQVNTPEVKRQSQDSYIPQVQGKLLESSSILLPQYKGGSQYTVISSFSLKNPAEKVDSKAVFGSAGLVYVSGNNIYVCEPNYNSNESDVTETSIRKVSYENGKFQSVGQTRIEGTLNDSFSIDEYKGNLRLVTTVSSTSGGGGLRITIFDAQPLGKKAVEDSNSLYILDEKLNELGKIEGLATGEQVYSARFMGDMGYFVTFKQVDPLFSVDLSDPKNPEVKGALKIPGFSEYLHPYGENLLLGIGMDVDETGTTTNGVKLSMFDTTDPSDVKEVQKYVLKDAYSAEVFYNYKAVLVNVDKNLFGFAAYGETQNYYLFSYDKTKGFQSVFVREVNSSQSARGVYVGEMLYLVAGSTIESYDMENFNKIDDLVL